MTLPTARAPVPEPSLEDASFLIIGAPKSGKSHLANAWPDCLVIDTQRGHRQLGGMVVEVSDVDDIRAVFKELMAGAVSQYKAIAIDTLDDVNVWMEAEALQRMRGKHSKNYTDLTEIPHGAGWGESRKLMVQLIESFKRLPVTKILVAHAKSLIDEVSLEKTRMVDLPGRLANIVPGIVDSIGISYRTPEGEFMLSFEGYESMSATVLDKDKNVTRQGKLVQHAGSRFKGLNGKQVEASYEAIVAAVKGAG